MWADLRGTACAPTKPGLASISQESCQTNSKKWGKERDLANVDKWEEGQRGSVTPFPSPSLGFWNEVKVDGQSYA